MVSEIIQQSFFNLKNMAAFSLTILIPYSRTCVFDQLNGVFMYIHRRETISLTQSNVVNSRMRPANEAFLLLVTTIVSNLLPFLSNIVA